MLTNEILMAPEEHGQGEQDLATQFTCHLHEPTLRKAKDRPEKQQPPNEVAPDRASLFDLDGQRRDQERLQKLESKNHALIEKEDRERAERQRNKASRPMKQVSPEKRKHTAGFRDSRLKKRLNPQTGPTSEQGKKAVSQNAIKHGFYARAPEGDREYAALEQAVVGQLEPVGEVQRKITNSIVFELYRIAKIEETVRMLDQGIDEERVNLSQLADQLEFPFSKTYAPLLLLYINEVDLRRRVLAHCKGVFLDLLQAPAAVEKSGRKVASQALGPMSDQANERAGKLLERATKLLNKDALIQHLETDFFQEFDAVMLETSLGRNKIGSALLDTGEMMPLVECWVYRNHMLIRVVMRRMIGSLRLDLMTDPKIERALKTSRSRLNSLLHDYLLESPNKLIRARALGFFE